MPLNISDDELAAIMNAAQPLPLESRDGFLQAVAARLGQCTDVGPGLVHRVCADEQKRFFDPPDLARSAGTPKWARLGRR